MRKNILALAILGSLSASAFAQDPRNSDIKVTADIHAGCDLTADNINFGVLMMPLSDSTAQANMNVKCSKGANLEIAINYSENASSSSNSNYRLGDWTSHDEKGESVNIYDANDNTKLGMLTCYRNMISQGLTDIYAYEYQAGFLNSIGLPNTITSSWKPDTYGVCMETADGFRVNSDFFTDGSIGALTGLTSGEQIKYSLSLPGNDSQIWSSSSKHSVLATGDNQTIPMKANIKRADNGTHRMIPDTYQSILTVVLNY